MEQRKAQLTEHIIAAVRELPEAQVAEVLDFASYLRTKYQAAASQRDIEQGFFDLLDHGGALQFAPGELDAILAEIDRARDSDLDANG